MAGSGGASPLGFLITQNLRRGLRGERQTFVFTLVSCQTRRNCPDSRVFDAWITRGIHGPSLLIGCGQLDGDQIFTPSTVVAPLALFLEVHLRVAGLSIQRRVIGQLGFLFEKIDLISRMYKMKNLTITVSFPPFQVLERCRILCLLILLDTRPQSESCPLLFTLALILPLPRGKKNRPRELMVRECRCPMRMKTRLPISIAL